MSSAETLFNRCNIYEVELTATRAHEGAGLVHFARLLTKPAQSSMCNFADFTCMPPGTSIGRHRHRSCEEEYYLILDGVGTMWRDGEEFPVRAGDLIRNPPGGSHGLVNSGSSDLRLFVFELSTYDGR